MDFLLAGKDSSYGHAAALNTLVNDGTKAHFFGTDFSRTLETKLSENGLTPDWADVAVWLKRWGVKVSLSEVSAELAERCAQAARERVQALKAVKMRWPKVKEHPHPQFWRSCHTRLMGGSSVH